MNSRIKSLWRTICPKYKKMEKVAVYSGTRNLYPHMVTAAKSLIMNSDVEKIYFLVEDDEFPYEIPDIIECINVSDQTYFPPECPNLSQTWFTYMAYMRGALAKIFPNLDTILSFDVDTIVDKDISDIWNLPIHDYYFSASKENTMCHDGYIYTNMGVTLFNLKKIREDHIDDAVIAMINEKELRCPEQTAYNELCQGYILDMPSDYNVTRYTDHSDNPKVIHYAGIKRWFDQPEVCEYEKYTFEDILKYRSQKKSRKEKKKPRHGTTYMIHAVPERKWYVDEFLIPSMMEQGIPKDDIIVWMDLEHKGNLQSFVDSMEWVGNNHSYIRGIWHLQDDIVISKEFYKKTQKNDFGIVCGFCNEIFDGGNVNLVGIVPSASMWFSFPCVRIPNYYAKLFAKWYYEEVVTNNLHEDYTKDGKHDDAMFRFFMAENFPNEPIYNMVINIVDHVDYLIGGSTVNTHREGIRKAYRWEEPDVVEELERKLRDRDAKSGHSSKDGGR